MTHDTRHGNRTAILIIHVEHDYALGLVPSTEERVFIPKGPVCTARPVVGETRYAAINLNTRKGTGSKYFASWLSPNNAIACEIAGIPTDQGLVYFFTDEDEPAWSDEPPAPGETAYAFRFEGVVVGPRE